MNNQLDRAYRDARDAMHDSLRKGSADPVGLRAVQKGMAALEPHKQAFGRGRYDELRDLLNQVERLPRRVELTLVTTASVPAVRYVPGVPLYSRLRLPIPQYRLSVDQMIGIFCLSGLLVFSGFDLRLVAIVGSIWAAVFAWRWLHGVAPVTAKIILLIFLVLFSALLQAGYRGRGRRY